MKMKFLFLAIIITNISVIRSQTIMNIYLNNGTVTQIPLNTIDSITYTIINSGNLATITTNAVTSVTGTTAVSGGIITNDGGYLITQRGVCFGTSPSPTIANSIIVNGSGLVSFSCNLTALMTNTTYYLRAFATNSAGTAYGNEVSFTTTSGSGTIVSNPGGGVTFNGYNYSSIVLGNGQEWMAENLRTTFYANGDPIPNVSDDIQWSNLSTGAWAHYDNYSPYEDPFGKLYNWYTVNDSRNICPTGWHVPTDSEWSALINYLGGGVNAGEKLKSTGTIYWNSPNVATNESGFSAFPGGFRYNAGTFNFLGGYGYWWSSTTSPINGTSDAWCYWVRYYESISFRTNTDKKYGFSVRCLKD
jgi:uncharacterized protein (TIGR02145 family)